MKRKPAPKLHARRWHQGSVKALANGRYRAWRARGPDGRRPSRTFTHREHAEVWAAGGDPSLPAVMTLGQWLARWVSVRRPTIRASTLVNYVRYAEMCGPVLLKPINETGSEEWQVVVNDLLGRFARSTVGAWRSIISAALLAAVPRYLPHNPLAGVSLGTKPEQPVKAWRQDEVDRLLEAAEGAVHEVWLAASIATGIRIGEARALLWADVDMEARTLTISKSVAERTGQVGPTKSGRIRVVEFPDELAPLLVAQRARQKPGVRHVFDTRSVGRPPSLNAYRSWLARLLATAGVSRYSPHATRHTYATLALEAGVPIKEVSEQLGHANIAITAQTYTHAADRGQRRAANALGQVLAHRKMAPKLLNDTRMAREEGG